MIASGFDADAAALAECANEPIHIPGTIQPCGVVLALDTNCDTVLIASANAPEHFSRPLAQILGQSASDVLGFDRCRRIRSLVGAARDRVVVPIPSLPPLVPAPPCAVLAHRHDGRVIVEIVDEADEWAPEVALASVMLAVTRAQRDAPAIAPVGVPSPDVARGVFERRPTTPGIDADLASLCQSAADEVRNFTGYDRVMVYQFDGDGHGEVIAEARRDDLEAFLGLHYPASDIPAQARALYLRTRVRVLASVSHVQVPLLAAGSAEAGRPLDLSAALLRSMSPIHLQYLRNMGVEATLVVSIVVDGRLWGLIACHHTTEKWPTHAMRAACELLSEFVSVQVAVTENFARARARSDANSAHGELIRRLIASDGRLDAALETLRTMISCGGVAVVARGDVHLHGTTPSATRVRDLADWCDAIPHDGHTRAMESLSLVEPAFRDIRAVASGVLALDLGARSDGVLFWFRPEQARTVRWAGAPTKAESSSGGPPRLSPRGSFSEWKEERSASAEAFTPDDLIVAEAIRSALLEVGLELLEARRKVARLEYVRVRSAVDAASDGIAITDASGRTIYVNAMFTSLTGFSVGDVADPRRLFTSVPPIGTMAARDAAEDVVVTSSSGTRVPVALRIDTIVDDEGQPAGTMFLVTDQRPKRALAAERQRLALRLAESQRLESLGIMAGGVAHDFNNLLTTISGNAALAHADLPSSGAVQESLSAIDEAVEHAAGLCRQLLSYAGKGHASLRPLELNALVADLVRLLRASLGSAHTIGTRLAGSLPSINGDQTQLRQVLMNLIINGHDAIGDAAGHIEVSTACVDADRATLSGFSNGEAMPAGRYVEVRVSDSGHGMDAETMSRIFDPFFSTKFAGRGLGLAAALGIAHGHQGGLRVTSLPGAGTTFTLLLPVAPGAPQRTDGTKAPAKAHLAGESRTILLVDDDAIVRNTVRRLLERRGFKVVQAADGALALALVSAQPNDFAMIVSDVSMPVMGGATLLRRLRTGGHDTLVLLFSGYALDDVSAIVADDPRTRFVQKPFSIEGLEGAMAALFASSVT